MNTSNQFFFLIGVATTVMLVMALAIVLFVLFYQKKMLFEKVRRQQMENNHNERMLRLALESQENERKRISRDIHDGVGVMLQALRNTVQVVAKNADQQDKAEIQELVNELTKTVRDISWDLMPATLERFGLNVALDELARRHSLRGTIPIRFVKEGSSFEIDIHQQLLLYRIAQEAIANAINHSKGSSIEMKATWTNTDFWLAISDNGMGFDFFSGNDRWKNLGMGINNMTSRAKLLNAELTFIENKPTGTTVQLKLPLHG